MGSRSDPWKYFVKPEPTKEQKAAQKKRSDYHHKYASDQSNKKRNFADTVRKAEKSASTLTSSNSSKTLLG
jgi:hypothetical protein